MKARKQNLDQEYSEFTVKKMKDIKGRIEEFLKEYNKNKQYSYIVSYEQGLFYYKDSVYNITNDVIKGLNAGLYDLHFVPGDTTWLKNQKTGIVVNARQVTVVDTVFLQK